MYKRQGDIVSRVTADVEVFSDGLLMGFTQLFTGLITIIGTLVSVSYTHLDVYKRQFINLSPKAGFAAACALAVLLAVFIGAYTSCRYLSFGSPNYDFGIFCNMFASMARDFTQTVSSERDAIIQHFEVHFSPVYYLMLPFYFVFRSPVTLQILSLIHI